MDFSLTQFYVIPAGNTLPTTGTTADLTAGQFGIFRQDYTPATAANVAAAKYIYVGQGRTIAEPGVGTKRSDKIYANRVIEWYKVTGFASANVQISSVSDFSAQCGETVTLSFSLKSFYINTFSADGLNQSVTVSTPCCECGEDPCTDVDAQALVDDFVVAINQHPRLSQFLEAYRQGTGSSSELIVVALPLTQYGERCDPSAFPYQFDRMYFRIFAYSGPATSQEYNVYDACDVFATVTVLQRASYPIGTSAAIAQLEKNYYSYNTTQKHLFKNTNFNNAFESQVVSGTTYDTFYVKFKAPENNEWNIQNAQDEMVILAVPTGEGTNIQTILTNFIGTAPTDETDIGTTTTTTTSTTTTSTSSTTTLVP